MNNKRSVITIPYTYLIGWSKYNKWYYGVRYGKGCNPTDLWVKYFTSSIYVDEFRKKYGEPDIIQIRKIFNTIKAAIDWEICVLRRLKLHETPHFLNKSCAGAIYYDEEVVDKIRQRALGNKKTLGYTNEYRLKNGMKLLTGKPKGSKHTEKAKKERSERLKGKPVHPNLKYSGGYKHTQEIKNKISHLANDRPVYFCKECSRNIKGTMNWNRHLSSERHRLQLKCS